jgi:hypothetical protein
MAKENLGTGAGVGVGARRWVLNFQLDVSHEKIREK